MSTVHTPSIWTGRTDGDGAEHARWHQRVRVVKAGADAATVSGDVALVGFASEEGVRRNQGRPGAAEGPDALRRALASLPLHVDASINDLGTVTVEGDDLEGGQDAVGAEIARALRGHRVTFVLGGGHETAFGSYLGWAAAHPDARVGILNLDAHFDLREAPRPSSGTPFLQAARAEQAAGREFRYAVVGISEAGNTRVQFDTARRLGVPWLVDLDCQPSQLARVQEFVAAFIADLDVVHLTIDLDVLPASVAPGVSAPAAVGVPMETIVHVCRQVAASGKLALVDVVELCPRLDIDGRTARAAARLMHEIVHELPTQDE